MATVHPGWYPDPQQTADPSERYWDGHSWSHQARPASEGSHPDGPAPGQAYHPPAAAARTSDGVLLAGWWTRVGATLLDALVLLPILAIAALPSVLTHRDQISAWWSHGSQDGVLGGRPGVGQPIVPDQGRTPDVFDPTTTAGLVLALVLVAVTVVYLVAFLRLRQATPGKLALGLRVRQHDQAGPLPWRTVLVRVLAMSPLVVALVVPGVGIWFTAIALVDCLWAAWGPDKQTVHDKIAGTNVVVVKEVA